MSAAVLRAENLQTFYGKSHILHGVSLKVGSARIVLCITIDCIASFLSRPHRYNSFYNFEAVDYLDLGKILTHDIREGLGEST